MFSRLRLYAALAAMLALSMLLTVACNGDSATAEETSTATVAAATDTEATSTSPASNAVPTDTEASDNGQSDSAAIDSTDTPASSDATTASSGQTDTDSLPGLEGYVDNRSGPVEVLQSLYSAVNLKQNARAYSYWQPSDQLVPFSEFAEGYANTESVTLATGEITTDVGAGQLYFAVPVTLNVTLTDGGTQTFVGCYVLHLARPEMQAEPPYSPLAIASADIKDAADVDTATLTAETCQ